MIKAVIGQADRPTVFLGLVEGKHCTATGQPANPGVVIYTDEGRC